MSRIHQITPFLHVPNLAEGIDLLTRVLRFEIKYSQPGYAYLEWGPASLRVLEEPGRARAMPGRDARMTVYIDVEDVDALHAELRAGLDAMPAGDVQGPHDKPWRQRELHVRLPDGNWLALGQPVKEVSA